MLYNRIGGNKRLDYRYKSLQERCDADEVT